LYVKKPENDGAWTITSFSPASSCDKNGEETITSNYKMQDKRTITGGKNNSNINVNSVD
jgi:hypothetical protein